METEKVVEMIDAITDGKRYSLGLEGEADNETCIDFLADRVNFTSRGDDIFQVDNPRTAREIAGALVAWANRKEREYILESEPHEDGMFHTKMKFIPPSRSEG